VAGDVAEEDADALVAEREHVVEATAGRGPVGGAVGGRHREAGEVVGHGGEQGEREQPDVVQQLGALLLERLAAAGLPVRVDGEPDGERGDARQRPQDRGRHRADDLAGAARHPRRERGRVGRRGPGPPHGRRVEDLANRIARRRSLRDARRRPGGQDGHDQQRCPEHAHPPKPRPLLGASMLLLDRTTTLRPHVPHLPRVFAENAAGH